MKVAIIFLGVSRSMQKVFEGRLISSHITFKQSANQCVIQANVMLDETMCCSNLCLRVCVFVLNHGVFHLPSSC